MYPLPTDMPRTTPSHTLEVTDPSLQDVQNSTQTVDGSEAREPSLVALCTYLAIRLLWGGLAIIGNSLTIFVVTKFERLQTCTNYLICSLAASDLLSGIMVPLVVLHELYSNTWVFIPVCLIQQVSVIIRLFFLSIFLRYINSFRRP